MIDAFRVTLNGVPLWQFPDGRRIPVLAGGDDGEDESEGKGGTATKTDDNEDEGAPAGGDSEAARARREARDLRKRLREAEAERDSLKAATQTDAERLAARAEAAEGKATSTADRLRKANLRLAVLSEAPELGIVDPKLAVRLVGTEGVEYDDEDEPDRAAVKAQLEQLVKDHPALTRAGDADGGRKGDGSSPDGKQALNDWLRGAPPPRG